jgi:hypothetical protein
MQKSKLFAKKSKPEIGELRSGFNKEGENLQWEADEFVYHPKSFFWYIQLILGSIVISLVPWVISGREDYISSIVIIIALLGLIIFAARKPHTRKYSLSNSSIRIDGQNFSMFDFSYYWVENFATHTQVTLVGAKRTAMPIAFYLKDEELIKKVLEILERQLPQTNPSQNPADWIARKLRL